MVAYTRDEFFELTQDVTIPDPDGTFAPTPKTAGQPVVFRAGRRISRVEDQYWAFNDIWLSDEQAELVKPHLKPAEPRIGQWASCMMDDYGTILAALGELGIVTKDHMKQVAEYLEFKNHSEIEQRNWITSYPS
jgi:hypothetical protein